MLKGKKNEKAQQEELAKNWERAENRRKTAPGN